MYLDNDSNKWIVLQQFLEIFLKYFAVFHMLVKLEAEIFSQILEHFVWWYQCTKTQWSLCIQCTYCLEPFLILFLLWYSVGSHFTLLKFQIPFVMKYNVHWFLIWKVIITLIICQTFSSVELLWNFNIFVNLKITLALK